MSDNSCPHWLSRREHNQGPYESAGSPPAPHPARCPCPEEINARMLPAFLSEESIFPWLLETCPRGNCGGSGGEAQRSRLKTHVQRKPRFCWHRRAYLRWTADLKAVQPDPRSWWWSSKDSSANRTAEGWAPQTLTIWLLVKSVLKCPVNTKG